MGKPQGGSLPTYLAPILSQVAVNCSSRIAKEGEKSPGKMHGSITGPLAYEAKVLPFKVLSPLGNKRASQYLMKYCS